MSQLNELKDKVPVLFVTAKGLEAAAVEAHLVNTTVLEHQHGSIYVVGEILDGRGYRAAVVEAGKGGNAAAVETERAIEHFSPSYLIFVGIAGGIKDVGIGDVVAAERVHGYHIGADDPDRLLARPSGGPCSSRLVKRARYESRHLDWNKKRITDMPNSVKVTVAPIAAGDTVLRNTRSAIYQYLRTHYNDAIAVEMESHGFLEAFQANCSRNWLEAIVVRGISDLLFDKDAADRSGSQPIAAAAAAAFAIHLLDCVLPDRDEIVHGKVVLDFSKSHVTRELLHLWICELRERAGDVTLEIDGISYGSIVLSVACSDQALQRLLSLFRSDRLNNVGGVRVKSITEDNLGIHREAPRFPEWEQKLSRLLSHWLGGTEYVPSRPEFMLNVLEDFRPRTRSLNNAIVEALQPFALNRIQRRKQGRLSFSETEELVQNALISFVTRRFLNPDWFFPSYVNTLIGPASKPVNEVARTLLDMIERAVGIALHKSHSWVFHLRPPKYQERGSSQSEFSDLSELSDLSEPIDVMLQIELREGLARFLRSLDPDLRSYALRRCTNMEEVQGINIDPEPYSKALSRSERYRNEKRLTQLAMSDPILRDWLSD